MKKLITPLTVTALAAAFAFAFAPHSITLYSIPIVYPLVAYALLLQVFVSIPAIIYKTEKYFDLTGSLTFISLTIFTLIIKKSLSLR